MTLRINSRAWLISCPRFVGWALAVAGLGLHLLVGVLYLSSGLVMPFPWVYFMWLVWILALAAVLMVVRRGMPWAPVVPALALVFWVIVMQLGAWFFGWTA